MTWNVIIQAKNLFLQTFDVEDMQLNHSSAAASSMPPVHKC